MPLTDIRPGVRRLSAALSCMALMAALLPTSLANAQDERMSPSEIPARSINLEDVPYPYPVQMLDLNLYGNDIRMAYMDAQPQGEPNGRTVLLLHGMNWFGEYWGETMERLTAEGYRVIAPDQIGFGRSSKPVMPYSLHDHVTNTRAILDELDIDRVQVLGHSMGGAIATRFAFSFPSITTHLVLVNPIALTDSRLSRGWGRLQDSYERRRDGRTYQAVRRNYEGYFVEWDESFERYINIAYGWTKSSEWPRLAKVRALNSQWLYQDPTVYDRPHIEAKTLFLAGADDGADFPEEARQTVEDIPDARLELIDNTGHMPFFESPGEFYPPLLEFLASDAPDLPSADR